MESLKVSLRYWQKIGKKYVQSAPVLCTYVFNISAKMRNYFFSGANNILYVRFQCLLCICPHMHVWVYVWKIENRLKAKCSEEALTLQQQKLLEAGWFLTF